MERDNMESINTGNVFVEFCCKAKEWIGEGKGIEGSCFCVFNFYSFFFIMRKQPHVNEYFPEGVKKMFLWTRSDVLEQMMKMRPYE